MKKIYRILTLSQAETFDFELVQDLSLSYARKSLDGTQVVVEYKSEPDHVDSSFYNLEEIHEVIWGLDWYKEEDL